MVEELIPVEPIISDTSMEGRVQEDEKMVDVERKEEQKRKAKEEEELHRKDKMEFALKMFSFLKWSALYRKVSDTKVCVLCIFV